MASQKAPNLEPKSILAAVSQTGIGGNFPVLDGGFSGGECRVFNLSFKDEASVAVRMPHATDTSNPDDTIATLQNEVRILQKLEAKGFLWAPRYRGASMTFDNTIKHPSIVFNWGRGFPAEVGRILHTTTAFFERRIKKIEILDHLEIC